MKNNFFKSRIMVALKGAAMGAADVIPGVSGGTIALITGIYQELIESIKSIDLSALKLLFSGKFSQFWKKINGGFLLSVVIGIGFSIFSLAKLMQYLLTNHPIQIWSFFFGLILASIVLIIKGIEKKKAIHIIPSILGIAFGAFICLVSPSQTPDAAWFICLSGAIAICAMILPGISGSFILLLLGKYAFIMEAVSTFDLRILAIFLIGALVGIILFSHFLSWLMKSYKNGTLFFLSGLMLGSLIKVWPWKMTFESGIDRPILPSAGLFSPEVLQAVIWCIVGLGLVWAIEFAGKKIGSGKVAEA